MRLSTKHFSAEEVAEGKRELARRLNNFEDDERERRLWLDYCNALPDTAVPPSLEQWRRDRAMRGNREGQNHD
jgi:hypothetical protein